jgi:hypothetical protein
MAMGQLLPAGGHGAAPEFEFFLLRDSFAHFDGEISLFSPVVVGQQQQQQQQAAPTTAKSSSSQVVLAYDAKASAGTALGFYASNHELRQVDIFFAVALPESSSGALGGGDDDDDGNGNGNDDGGSDSDDDDDRIANTPATSSNSSSSSSSSSSSIIRSSIIRSSVASRLQALVLNDSTFREENSDSPSNSICIAAVKKQLSKLCVNIDTILNGASTSSTPSPCPLPGCLLFSQLQLRQLRQPKEEKELDKGEEQQEDDVVNFCQFSRCVQILYYVEIELNTIYTYNI